MENNLTLEEKVYGLSLLWKEAEYNFAFWDKLKDLNWNNAYIEALQNVVKTNDNREYYLELMKFMSLLRDGHTGIFSLPAGMLEMYETLPFQVWYIDDKHVIMNTDKHLENEIFSEMRLFQNFSFWNSYLRFRGKTGFFRFFPSLFQN
jgi:hypothetical protein